MEILFFVLFIAIALCIFSVSYFYYRDILNPIGIFGIVWFSSVAISQLMLSGIQEVWMQETWFVVLISSFCFLAGALIVQLSFKRVKSLSGFKIPINHYSFNRLRKTILLLFALAMSAYFFEVYKNKGMPLLAEAKISSYMNFGVQYIHYLTVLFIVVCVLAYLCKNLFPFKNRKLFNLILVMSLFALLSMLGTNYLIFVFTGIFVIENYIRKRINITKFIILFAIAILMLATVTGFMRASSSNITYVKEIGKPTIDIPDNLSFLFLPYTYIATNFNNLQIEIRERDNFYYGGATFLPIWAFTFQKGNFDIEYNIGHGGFNVGTYLRTYYIDYGLLGIVIFPFILGFLIMLLYCSLRHRPTIFKILIYGLVVHDLILVFFANSFALPTSWFFAAVYLIVDVYCREGLFFPKKAKYETN